MTETDVTIEPVSFADLPGWENDDHRAAYETFLKSCQRLVQTEQTGRKDCPPELLALCETQLRRGPEQLANDAARHFFETRFVPHRVKHNAAEGLLTGYYEPLLMGSREPVGRFRIPVYRRPSDLVNLVDETERGAKSHGLTHARLTATGTEPYATRAQIEHGALQGRGLELLYLDDLVDTFFMHVQGSGRIELPDGTRIRITYDGKNGHPYTSIGRYLVDAGLFPADRMSLESLQDWLKADLERARPVLWQNASFVFFRELRGAEAEAPMGAKGIPLTSGRSLAVDTGYHAIGTPVYVSAPTLMHATGATGFHRLMIAQDVGSAIKGPERGDIYFGSGPEAGTLAGSTKHAGKFFVLLPAQAAEAVGAARQAES